MWEIVEKLMELKGLRASDVSKATGIPQSVFTDWKKGRYTPKADKLYVLAKFFGVPMEYFFGDYEAIVGNVVSVTPVYEVSAGGGRVNEDYPTKQLGNNEGEEMECSWCEVHGDSMYPILFDGDLVKVCHQTKTSPKDLTVVKIDGESSTVKYVEVVKDGVWLRAENKEVFEDRFYTIQDVLTLPVSIIGKVVEMQRKL